MNQSINTDSKNSKEPQQKYRLGTVSIKILGGLNRFYKYQHYPTLDIYLSLSFSDQKRIADFQTFNTAFFKTNFNLMIF